MKKFAVAILVMIFVAAALTPLSFAGNGSQAGSLNGARDGSGPVHYILEGTAFSLEGIVVSCTPEQGLTVAVDTIFGNGEPYDEDGDGNVVIFGIGPSRYWEELEAVKPTVGEWIKITGYVADFNGVLRNIAMTVFLPVYDESGGIASYVEVQLRDPETGYPLWRGVQHRLASGK